MSDENVIPAEAVEVETKKVGRIKRAYQAAKTHPKTTALVVGTVAASAWVASKVLTHSCDDILEFPEDAPEDNEDTIVIE